jgi:hypothetical protein
MPIAHLHDQRPSPLRENSKLQIPNSKQGTRKTKKENRKTVKASRDGINRRTTLRSVRRNF